MLKYKISIDRKIFLIKKIKKRKNIKYKIFLNKRRKKIKYL
jgi:hypothetical protein